MKRFGLLLLLLVLLSGCGAGQAEHTFVQISQTQAQEMMAREDGHIVVDVRRQDEYDAGHIPDAVLIPNESITDTPPEQLPDKAQIILLYCRTGNRSKQAAQKLADMGYTHVYEFGGVNTWPGELVTERAPALWTAEELPVHVRYDRYWEYGDTAESDDPALIATLVEAIRGVQVGGTTDIMTTDFTDYVTFTFADGSTVELEFENQCWVAEGDVRYEVTGLGPVRAVLEAIMEQRQDAAVQSVPTLVIQANGHTLYAALEDNPSAAALVEQLSSGPIEVALHDYGSFEKVGDLPWSLPRSDSSITTVPGDIILYQGSQITIYYDENTWDFTRLARISGASRDALLDVLGDGDVTVTFSLEWSE